ncbi:MAG: Tn3 family transposase [Isosphaeraceae bacterium]
MRHWDELLRVAGALKLGWVTASLLIGKLQSYPRKNRLTRALQEWSTAAWSRRSSSSVTWRARTTGGGSRPSSTRGRPFTD